MGGSVVGAIDSCVGDCSGGLGEGFLLLIGLYGAYIVCHVVKEFFKDQFK